jgi:hypothetical protein
MRVFFGIILIVGAIMLCSCSSSDDHKATPTPTPTETLTWDAQQPTWDNGKWK